MEYYTISEIVQIRGNIILAADEDLGAICTANGSYFQIWIEVKSASGIQYDCLEAYDLDSRMSAEGRGLYGLDTAKLIDVAEALLKEHFQGVE